MVLIYSNLETSHGLIRFVTLFARNRVELRMCRCWSDQDDNRKRFRIIQKVHKLIHAEAQEQLLVDFYVDSSSRCRTQVEQELPTHLKWRTRSREWMVRHLFETRTRTWKAQKGLPGEVSYGGQFRHCEYEDRRV